MFKQFCEEIYYGAILTASNPMLVLRVAPRSLETKITMLLADVSHWTTEAMSAPGAANKVSFEEIHNYL